MRRITFVNGFVALVNERWGYVKRKTAKKYANKMNKWRGKKNIKRYIKE